MVNGQPVQQATTGENGLSTSDANELRGMIDTCGKIHEAATVFMPLANGGNDKDWGAVLNDATRVAGRANDVLNANYSSTTVATQFPDEGNNTGLIGGGIGGFGGFNNNNGYNPYGPGSPNGSFPNNNGNRRQPPSGNSGNGGNGDGDGGGGTGKTPPPPTPIQPIQRPPVTGGQPGGPPVPPTRGRGVPPTGGDPHE